MKLFIKQNFIFIVTILLSVILYSDQLSYASPQGGILSKGIGGLLGATSGAIAGGLAGASAGADAASNSSSSSASANASINAQINSGNGSFIPEGFNGQFNLESSASASASSSGQNQASSSTTPKPEGFLGRMKDLLMGKDDKKDQSTGESSSQASANASAFGSILNATSWTSSQASSSAQTSGGSNSTPAQAHNSSSSGQSTPKPDNFLEKFIEKSSDSIKKRKENLKESIESIKEELNKKKEEFNSTISKEDNGNSGNSSKEIKDNADGNSNEDKKERTVDKLSKLVAKGSEAIRETFHKVENRSQEFSDRVSKALDENFVKPMHNVSGSGQQNSQGHESSQGSASAQMKGNEREKKLIEQKKKQELDIPRPNTLREVVDEARNKGIIPQNEDSSNLKGKHDDENSVAVEVFDRAHEMSKIPVETVLKPIDKILGVEKDPLLKIYDNSHNLLRKPLSVITKPVESVLTGAFKTSDEAKKENEKLLAMTSESERKAVKAREEEAKKENRSIAGDIADKTVELATKPIEIVLKPFDHAFGFDKDGKKNPLLKALDELYALSKKPLDSLARPFENILKKMAEDEQIYQMPIRIKPETNDPKLMTRFADGALNIADRVMTKPLEIVLRPLDHALGYDEPGKKNPIFEAVHSLKNATKIGFELFTKPIDRILKEIANMGDSKLSDSERDSEFKRQREDASRIVEAFDKLHDIAQAPFEIVLRPIGKAFGLTKDGKEPILRAWDLIYQIIRTPVQVISKPVEDAIFNERPKKKSSISGDSKSRKGDDSSNNGNKQGNNSGSNSTTMKPANEKKNYITEHIKKIEKFAMRPFDVITSPMRRLILGEEGKIINQSDKNNREIQSKAKATIGSTENWTKQNSTNQNKTSENQDKIMNTLERINNVLLKPFEMLTQPISDTLFSDNKDNQEKENSTKSNNGSQNQGSSNYKFQTSSTNSSLSTNPTSSKGLSKASSTSTTSSPSTTLTPTSSTKPSTSPSSSTTSPWLSMFHLSSTYTSTSQAPSQSHFEAKAQAQAQGQFDMKQDSKQSASAQAQAEVSTKTH